MRRRRIFRIASLTRRTSHLTRLCRSMSGCSIRRRPGIRSIRSHRREWTTRKWCANSGSSQRSGRRYTTVLAASVLLLVDGNCGLILRFTVLSVIVHALIPFRVSFEPGVALYEQVVYAAKKAVISGQMRPGEPFPSVRALSKALKINPNTAHKVIMQLVSEGLIEVHPGLGTIVAERPSSTAAERSNLLKKELEQLVVEAKRLGLDLDEVMQALEQHWRRLNVPEKILRSK